MEIKWVQFSDYFRVGLRGQYPREDGSWHSVDFRIERKNGDRWETQIRGQIKQDGCVDLGYGEQVLFHCCEREDLGVFLFTFDEAMKVIEESKS